MCRYDYDIGREQPELSSSAPLSELSFHLHADYVPLKFTGPAASAARAYGVPEIVPVTTSGGVGSPEPPLPDLRGAYLYADYSTGRIRAFGTTASR